MSSPRESLRVVIADDHPAYRAGLGRELRANGIEVVATVPNVTRDDPPPPPAPAPPADDDEGGDDDETGGATEDEPDDD